MAAKRVVFSASPHAGGACENACALAAGELVRRYPCDEVVSFQLSRLQVGPCIGCERCRTTSACFQNDDMTAILDVFESADELFIASPVYFAGPPAPYKAVLDRVQALYWRYRNTPAVARRAKRPLHLLVVGNGGDPHGFEPVVTCTKSALAIARFSLDHVEAAIGDDVLAHVPAWLDAGEGAVR